MGKSAKFYKRPTRKEKMGLSNNLLTKSLPTSVKSGDYMRKFMVRDSMVMMRHDPIKVTKEQKYFSLIEDNKDQTEIPLDDCEKDDVNNLRRDKISNDPNDLQVRGGSSKKRRDLRSKANRLNKTTVDNYDKDYVDLFEKPDPRKRSFTNQ
ncbi:hypothetical protein BY996DRAFT_8690515 [Phakopsora pachyrhizi]|uniref:Uncharacterized protein n=1 Tax=Phakopsora pachyrhizi TaxID=170000 RepID=A0AAV0BME5_PHAPC|nr:hypothetical protein BY996DRAFT_8695803 [Phakopsora pachyrhizi]KAI8448667.1 hypothetical protein BY996DRAFT_8690515 [Phakopsora pachyrhizi]CAH7688482.1 hypothetical protein PPACK8108_LOCUS23454 [Phakopsora pachyrhizi]